MSRAQAGTLQLSTSNGVSIKSETVKEHRSAVTGEVIFRELVGFEITESWPGAAKDLRVTWLSEPSNVELTRLP